jgi:hypothetical protein
MELMCRYQQQQWEGKGVYTESVLASLIITRHFGQPYPVYQHSHQYGLTHWYKLLLYCVYCNCHWTLVAIFVTAEHYIALRVDPLSEEMDASTMNILQHLHWTMEQSQQGGHRLQRKQQILIDIQIPSSTDKQACGHRVLQYHQILGDL